MHTCSARERGDEQKKAPHSAYLASLCSPVSPTPHRHAPLSSMAIIDTHLPAWQAPAGSPESAQDLMPRALGSQLPFAPFREGTSGKADSN
jgi:hypothetical protein